MAQAKPTQTTRFSQEHFHELSADETETRERGFESQGSPVEGPSLREAEQEAESEKPPHLEHEEPLHHEHVEPEHRVHAEPVHHKRSA